MHLPDKLNRWFKKYIVWVYCILILSWCGVRFFYYCSIINSPLYSLYLFKESDNRFFDDWAKYLNKDWLNANPFHPYNWWHKSFANYYLQKHPEKLNEILAGRPAKDSSFIPGKVLWNEWYHGNQYHQEPLYSYLLAVFYYFNIDEVRAMIILQLILGVLSGVLLLFITRKYFGETTAVLTGVLYLLCGILMYNEIILLRTSWIVFLTVLNVVVIDRVFSNHRPFSFFLCGLCIGFSLLVQSTFSLFLIGVLIITFFSGRQNLVQYFKNSSLLLLGFFIVFSPVVIRNKIVGAPAFSTSSVGPVTFIASNVYGTDSISTWNPPPEKDAEIMGQSYKSLSDAIIATIKTYPSIVPYFSLEWKKLKATWSGIEFPNNENYYFYKQNISVLRYLNVNFFWIAPLSLAGLIICVYYRKKYYALYLAIIVQLITLLTFYVLARFRTPLVILLLPLAAFAVVECINARYKKKPMFFAEIILIAGLLCLSFSGYSTSLGDEMVTGGNYETLYSVHFERKLNDYMTQKQWDKWLEFQKQFIDMEPDYVKNANTDNASVTLNHIDIAHVFGKMHQERREIYDYLGDKANAYKEDSICNTIDSFVINSLKGLNKPDSLNNFYDAESFNNQAVLYLNLGKNDLAMADLNKSVALYPTSTAYFNRGRIYSEHFGEIDSAIVNYTKAIKLDSNFSNAYINLGLLYYKSGKTNFAVTYYNKAIALAPNSSYVYNNLGLLYLNNHKNDSAIAYFTKAISLDSVSAPYFYNRGLGYEAIHKYEKAVSDFTNGIQLNPQSVELYYNMRGTCNVNFKKYDEAIADFSKAIEINSLVPDYWFNRSDAEYKTGENEKAKADKQMGQQLQRK